MRQGCVCTVVRARVWLRDSLLVGKDMVSLLQCWSDLLKAWVCTYCRASQTHRNTESFHALSGLSPFLGKEQQASQSTGSSWLLLLRNCHYITANGCCCYIAWSSQQLMLPQTLRDLYEAVMLLRAHHMYSYALT
ncbi:hypothetical protein CI102_5636 [Trichoderma harzianum]|nr:hypothetical protein CI102_5636 [Trichoderma harzianum]